MCQTAGPGGFLAKWVPGQEMFCIEWEWGGIWEHLPFRPNHLGWVGLPAPPSSSSRPPTVLLYPHPNPCGMPSGGKSQQCPWLHLALCVKPVPTMAAPGVPVEDD